ncbi:MAG: winged helix-turn-helix domain-containing protein [Candidatus Bathyarchaeia archaeon]|jgi:predicted transcriptional regulator
MMQKGSFSQTKGNRDRLGIFSDMLTCAIGGTRKTEIMRRVGLSSLQLHKYMDVLTRFGLLDVQILKRTATYRTTPKGKSFLEAFGTLAELIS